VLPRYEMVMVLETCPGNLLELEEMEGLEELVLELGHGDASCVCGFSCAWQVLVLVLVVELLV